MSKTFIIKCISHDDDEKHEEFVVRSSDPSLALYSLLGNESSSNLWQVCDLPEGQGFKGVFIIKEVKEIDG